MELIVIVSVLVMGVVITFKLVQTNYENELAVEKQKTELLAKKLAEVRASQQKKLKPQVTIHYPRKKN